MTLIDSDGLIAFLDAAQIKHKLITNNLANVNTPGYRSLRVRFTQELDRVLDERGNPRAGKDIRISTYRPLFDDVGPDGNDVSLEREVMELNKNTLRAKIYLKVLGYRIAQLRSAIGGK